MSDCIRRKVEGAVKTIEDAGLVADVKSTSFYKKGEKMSPTGEVISINIKSGVRPVSVWPIQGTVFSSKMRNKKSVGGWKFNKAVRVKGLSFEASIYAAVQVAITGGY